MSLILCKYFKHLQYQQLFLVFVEILCSNQLKLIKISFIQTQISMKPIFIGVIAFLMIIASSQSIANLDQTISIQSSQQYLQYVEAILGVASQNTFKQNPELANLVKNQRISVLNAIQKVVLILSSNNQNQRTENTILFNYKQAKKLDKTIESFQILDMIESNKQQVSEKIKNLEKEGIHVNVLNGAKKQIEVPQRRMLQTVTSSYILKFFFSLMFIIITVGTLLSISNMQNGKDTLLYAKFIADVGR